MPEEAGNEGIEDKAASPMFMPCIPCIVCPDWSCPDLSGSCVAFWAKDEIVSIATAAIYLAAVRMHHSRANTLSFV
jgi:hypothetical protein